MTAWPLPNDTRRRIPSGARGFAADRGGEKYHAAIDLYADRGDPVVAPQPGRVVNIYNWPNNREPTGRAVLIQSDHGPVFLLAPLEPSTLRVGFAQHVAEGENIGQIGVYPAGSSMLHFEVYREGTRTNQRWFKGKPRPPELLDPLSYLEAAKMDAGDAIERPPYTPTPTPGPSQLAIHATGAAGVAGALLLMFLLEDFARG